MKKLFTLAFFMSAVLSGCVHTNNLEKYELSGSTIYFEEELEPGAAQVQIVTAAPSEEESKRKKSAIEVIGDVATGIGTAIAGNAAEEKLIRAAEPDVIIDAVSGGVEKTLTRYFSVRSTSSLQDDPAFIVTTKLEHVQFNSTPGGMFLEIQATMTMRDRKNAMIVWENRESETVSLTRWYEGFLTTNTTLSNVSQTARLASLSEEQLRNAVSAAAQEVGQEMAETLRDDIADAEKKKLTAKD